MLDNITSEEIQKKWEEQIEREKAEKEQKEKDRADKIEKINSMSIAEYEAFRMGKEYIPDEDLEHMNMDEYVTARKRPHIQ